MFEGEPGGAIYPSREGEKGIMVYFETDDIDSEIGKIRDLGGTIDEKMPVPSMGWFAQGNDTEGNRFAVWQSDEIAHRCPRAWAHSPLRARRGARVEELELWRGRSEDRPRHELTAREAEDVAVARVAGGDPDAVVAGHRTDER